MKKWLFFENCSVEIKLFTIGIDLSQINDNLIWNKEIIKDSVKRLTTK